MTVRPFRPYVTLDHIQAFRPGQPDTRTPSPLVDAVLECFEVKKLRNAWEIGRYLQLEPRALSHYLLIATGFGITELRRHWTLSYARRYAAAHPRTSADEMARALGFKDRSSLWQTENAEHVKARNKRNRAEADRQYLVWSAKLAAERKRKEEEERLRREEEERMRREEELTRNEEEGLQREAEERKEEEARKISEEPCKGDSISNPT